MRVHVTNDVVYSDLIRVRHRLSMLAKGVNAAATKYADVHPGLGGVVGWLLSCFCYSGR